MKNTTFIVSCVLWIAAMAVGFQILWAYKSTPGPRGNVAMTWPEGSSIKRNSSGMTLVMFGHPMCPCTRASVNELARISGEYRGNIMVYVVFALPDGVSGDWENSSLWKRAVSVPEFHVVPDPNGNEASRFGVMTSGHVVLYDTQGKLAFNGGITQLRGHEGDSFGRARILSVLTKGKADKTDSPVFGCALHSNTVETKYIEGEKTTHAN